jgi:hypothetical protein
MTQPAISYSASTPSTTGSNLLELNSNSTAVPASCMLNHASTVVHVLCFNSQCSWCRCRPKHVQTHVSARCRYDEVVTFLDPITKYSNVQGYMFNIKMLKSGAGLPAAHSNAVLCSTSSTTQRPLAAFTPGG